MTIEEQLGFLGIASGLDKAICRGQGMGTHRGRELAEKILEIRRDIEHEFEQAEKLFYPDGRKLGGNGETFL